jgi:anthranilate phosphoribosyltransferase
VSGGGVGMSVVEALRVAVEGREVEPARLEAAFAEIMEGQASPAAIAGLLVALRMKGETVDELVAVARALRAASSTTEVSVAPVDCCGTGGSGIDTFNVSTTVAFVVAGAGVPVAKHGNRAASSRTGSFDTFEALGVRIDLPIEICGDILERIGIAPFFARTAHPAFRHLAPIRAELGVRTLVNALGPLLNPAGARRQVVGVYDPALVRPLAEALGALGAERALVVHGSDGMDELTTTGSSHAAHFDGTGVSELEVKPEALGLPLAKLEDLAGGEPRENAAMLRAVLAGAPGPHRDIVLLNAAAVLWVADAASGLEEGLVVAADSIDSGRAADKLEQLVVATREAA